VVDTARMDAPGVGSPAGELRLQQRVSLVLPMTGRRWLVQCEEAGELLVVDQRLRPLWRLQVPAAAGWGGIHAVAEDLSLVALSLEEHVLLLDGTGQPVAQLSHRPLPPYNAGCCVFAGDGRHLWATGPHEVPERPWEGGDELWLIDLATRSLIARRRLDTGAAICLPVRHPDGQTIGLFLGEAEGGGSDLVWVRVDRGRISLRHAPGRDRILMDVHPDGGEYLTTPDIDADAANELRRHRFADDQPLDALALPADAAGEQVWWDYHAGYLSDELIVASVTEPDRQVHVLVQRQPLRPLGSVAYPDGGDPPGWLRAPREGSWLTVGAGGVQRWLLPDWPARAGQAAPS
jgi:hypothetical protein